LKRPPRGFDREHPLINDLMRKDFVASVDFTEKQACSAEFLEEFTRACRYTVPLVRFLARAIELPF